jgi:CheY-like chemotaxis protein
VSTIVIVDDDVDIADALSNVLEEEGYTVVACHSGSEGSAIIADRQPDLVLMDVMMPGLSGLDVVRLMRKDPDLAQIPVILMSAVEPATSREDGGFQAFIRKPFPLQVLLDRVKQHIDQGRLGGRLGDACGAGKR